MTLNLNSKVFAFVALLIAAPFAVAQESDTTAMPASDTLKITLDQALQIALSESNTIKIADMTVEKTGYARKGAYASLYPNINGTGSYQRTLKKQVMAMEIGGTLNEFEVGMNNNMNLGVSASMPLVNAQLWQSLKLSATNLELSIEQARSSKISMVSQVKKAFYGALLAKESYNVLKDVYDNSVKNYEETYKKYLVGKASEFAMLRSKVSMMNAEPNVYNAENALALAIWQLKALMGIDLQTNIDIEGNLSDYTGEVLVAMLYDDSISLYNNSSMRQLKLQDRQLEETLKMQKFQYLPTLAGSFSYNFVAMGNTFDMNWNPYSVAGVSLTVPIFDGFSKHSSIQQTIKTRDILRLQITDTERNLRISIKNYIDQINLSIKNYEAAHQSVEVAQKSYNISEKMYEIGKATLVELNDAQLALTQSQLTMYQAIYSYMVAQTSLDELLGKEE